MLKRFPTQALVLLALLPLSGCESGPEPEPIIAPNYHLLSPCKKSDIESGADIIEDSLCGTISVYEDRLSQSGRMIDLNIMLLPALTSMVKHDPIFFLAGGPGQSAVDAGAQLFSRLKEMRNNRDIVLVDQRGTGKSNSLACPLDLSLSEIMSLSIAEVEMRQRQGLRQCLDEYDAKPALYTTPIAMDDLEEVRSTLGYPKINLYGISYGTRAALVYLRRHEDSVRSVILDSVAPLSMTIPKNVAIDAQSAFKRLVEDCQQQISCEQAYSNLHGHFRAVVQKLRDEPEDITILHPRTGKKITGKVDPLAISRIIRGTMYDRTLSRLLPLAIEEAYKGNYQTLSTLSYVFSGDEGDMGISMGMMVSVLCAEDMTLIDGASDSADFDNAMVETLKPICEFWPKGKIDSAYFAPVHSDVPVLLTSGLFDPITPPKYGTEAALTLSNSVHLVVPGVGHMASIHGCLPKLMIEFLNDTAPKALEAECINRLQRPPFFTSFAGALDSDVEKDVEKDKQDD